MGNLSDYLDELAVKPGRGFGTVPSLPTLINIGPVSLPAVTPQVQALFNVFSQADRATIDAQMWQLDSRWLGSATWADMRMCVVGRGDVSGGTVASPYRGAGTCRTPTGAEAQPTCSWGFWRIDRCDLDTASSLAFQFPRYLWAQSRMRDLLASKPVPGRVNDDVAAAWAWSAAQLISVLLWSTNVRFDNPNSAVSASSYTAGQLAPTQPNRGVPYDGQAVSGTPFFYLHGIDPRVLNAPGYMRVAPTRQLDFNPGRGPLPFMYAPADQPRSAQPDVVYRGFQFNGTDYRSNLPLGLTLEQTQQVKTAAYNYATSSGDADALRWASTKAMNDFWFRATWGWGTSWRALPGLTYHGQPVVIGGASVVVEDLARQLAWYSDATKTYVSWMQQAMRGYNLDTAFMGGNATPAVIDFVNAKFNLTTAINAAAAASEAASRSGTTGTDTNTATITSLTASLFQSVFTLIAQTVPVIGYLYAALQQLTQLIVGWAGGAIGNVPCPAFPFLRVMAPTRPCTLSTDDITSSFLGISSSARWPVNVAGQTRSFAVDGKTFTTTFTATDTTADLVARRINAAAALVGLGQVASVRSGQVSVEARDPGAGPARATGGTACALGFPGPCTVPTSPTPAPGSTPPGSTPTPSKPSSLPLLVGGALLLRLLLG